MNINEILDWLRSIAPEESAFANDPVGLLVHPSDVSVSHIGVCLDTRLDIVRQAAASDVQLIVCHHPLIYAPLRKVLVEDPIGAVVSELIRAGISLYAAHTNWDLATGGINDILATGIGLLDIQPLAASGDAAIARIGTLASPLSFTDFATKVSSLLGCCGESALRFTEGIGDREIRRVAVCGGAGAFLIGSVIAAGADAYVTSDVRHHEFVESRAHSFALIDAGHGATERPGMRALAQRLREAFPAVKVTVWE